MFNREATPKQVGAVLVVREGVSKQQVLEALRKAFGDDMEWATVQDFNPNHGGPVWYVP